VSRVPANTLGHSARCAVAQRSRSCLAGAQAWAENRLRWLRRPNGSGKTSERELSANERHQACVAAAAYGPHATESTSAFWNMRSSGELRDLLKRQQPLPMPMALTDMVGFLVDEGDEDE